MAGLFSALLGRLDRARAAQAGCDAVMAAALDPAPYEAGAAQDTFDGRFEMSAVYAALAMRRLRAAEPNGRKAADALYRAVFNRYEHALREDGAGDATIAKKVRGLGERFFGLARAVDAGLDAGGGALEIALARNGMGGRDPGALAAHFSACDDALAGQDDADVSSGRYDWPEFKAL